jgi:hypothetical protein
LTQSFERARDVDKDFRKDVLVGVVMAVKPTWNLVLFSYVFLGSHSRGECIEMVARSPAVLLTLVSQRKAD